MKKVLGVYGSGSAHWVGDGFPVRSMFSHDTHGGHVSPFLLLDYAGPTAFEPTGERRGVGAHPHRGFETVTIVYQGEVEHRDSTGRGGIIGPGDVQWMTAGGGILHEEFHSEAFATKGGAFEMVQLWVNLPAKDKNTAPGYQSLNNADIPRLSLPNGEGSVRVIAGEYNGVRGPAKTFTPINMWDVRLAARATVSMAVPERHNTAVVVLKGAIVVNGVATATEAQFALLDKAGGEIMLTAHGDASVLLLSGEPIDEPVVMHGPFVMNTTEEIRQAITDFKSGRFGEIAIPSALT